MRYKLGDAFAYFYSHVPRAGRNATLVVGPSTTGRGDGSNRDGFFRHRFDGLVAIIAWIIASICRADGLPNGRWRDGLAAAQVGCSQLDIIRGADDYRSQFKGFRRWRRVTAAAPTAAKTAYYR